MLVVQQNSHQLRDGHSWMSIVELDGDLFGKRSPICVSLPETPNQIRKRTGNEKILLHETQPLPQGGRIIRVEYAGQRFRLESLGHGAYKITVAECLKIEEVGRTRGPEPERIDILASVPHHGPIEGDSDQRGGPSDDGTQGS